MSRTPKFNPTPDRAAIHLEPANEGPVTAGVFDVTGRRVRALLRETMGAGGRDDAGRAVATGVYLARVSTPEGAKTARVVIVK